MRASIVRLRRADPERWTFAALAHRFGGTDSNAYAVVRAGARAGAVAASGRAGHATLLALFGTAMSVSFGVKSPLDYSVFSASAGALLLALHERAPA